MLKTRLKLYRQEVLEELTGNILDFWMKNVVNFDSGGFHGSVNGNGVANPAANKGVIMATRILWTFSRAYASLKDERYLKVAELIHRYIQNHFIDQAHGGVFWVLDQKGKPLDSAKKFYGQAFAIYALSEYSIASGDRQALDEAKTLFHLVEKHGRDPIHGGYLDARGADWGPLTDTRLSARDLNVPKGMNTNLHILEAYSGLARAGRDEAVIEALESLVGVFLKKILLPNRHFGIFFDLAWNEVSGTISYGHDIEGSWLLAEAAALTGRQSLIQEVAPFATGMAQAILDEGLDAEGGVLSEREADGSLHPGRVWWSQAEAMVGFFNAYEMTHKEIFAEKSLLAWDYCKKKFIRPGGEWYSNITEEGKPDLKREIAGAWKCPYHTGRACFEIIERINGIL